MTAKIGVGKCIHNHIFKGKVGKSQIIGAPPPSKMCNVFNIAITQSARLSTINESLSFSSINALHLLLVLIPDNSATFCKHVVCY